MDILAELIHALDRKEVKQYKVFVSRSASEDQRKDIQLFDYIRKAGNVYEEEKIFRKLYADGDKNAYYRLKNRLAEDIGKSVFLQQYREDGLILCYYLLAMAHYSYKKGNYKLSFNFYRKAEKKAIELENFSLLEIIYSRMIVLARKVLSINPEKYIQRRRENRERLRKLSELEDVVGAVEYRMKLTQNYDQSHLALQEMLQKTINEYTEDEELKNSAKLQLAIHNIVSQQLLQKKDYVSLENYLSRVYEEFNAKGFFNKNTHSQKLQLLTWLANAAFKNKHYQQSLAYAEVLKEEMERYDKMLYSNFLIFYYNTRVINYSVINLDKAISILEELAVKENVEHIPYYGQFIYLNLALFYFQKKNFKASMKALQKLYKHAGYQDTDRVMRLKIGLGELLLRYELKEQDITLYRYRQISKDYEELLMSSDFSREATFLSFFESLASAPTGSPSRSLVDEIKAYLERYKKEFGQDEALLFRYDQWLAEKVHL